MNKLIEEIEKIKDKYYFESKDSYEFERIKKAAEAKIEVLEEVLTLIKKHEQLPISQSNISKRQRIQSRSTNRRLGA